MLPLNTFREVFGFHPWHFYQLTNSDIPIQIGCDTIVSERSWQATDAVGRAEIRDAIEMAEQRLAVELGFYPYPRAVQVDIPFPQFFDVTDQYLASSDQWGRWLAFRLPFAYPSTIGTLTYTKLETGVITYVDLDGDGFKESYEISVLIDEIDPDMVGVYVREADRIGSQVLENEIWRVQIDTYEYNTTTGIALIRGPAYMCAKRTRYSLPRVQALDPANPSDMLIQLDVYRVAYDTTQQGSFLWESGPTGLCVTAGDDPSSIGSTAARFVVRSPELGYVAGEAADLDTDLAAYIAINWPHEWQPSRVRVNYKSGYESRALELAVCRLAAAELARPICACQQAYREFSSWQQDLAIVGGDDAVSVSQADLDNPFGTRRGHIYAWKLAQQYKTSRVSISG